MKGKFLPVSNNVNDSYRNAFIENLVKKHGNRIANLAYRLIGNRTDAEDLTQEVLLQVYRKFSQFNPEMNLSPWLYRITVNIFKNKVRYEKRHKTKSYVPLDNIDSETEKNEIQISEKNNTIDQIEIKQEQEMVRKSLDMLSTDDRTIIVLRDIEQKSYAEIAGILKCPAGTVKSRLFYARDTLYKILLKQRETK